MTVSQYQPLQHFIIITLTSVTNACLQTGGLTSVNINQKVTSQ